MHRRIIIVLLAIVALTTKAQLTDWRNISSHNFVMKIIHDQNYLYVGTKGGGIVKIDKQSGEQTVLKRAGQLSHQPALFRLLFQCRWNHACG